MKTEMPNSVYLTSAPTKDVQTALAVRRYDMGFFQGAPAMFEQPEGQYVKYDEAARAQAEEVAKLMAMTEEEIDAELRSYGIEPADAVARGEKAIRDAVAASHRGSFVCPLCGKTTAHKHTPNEIVIFRNGIKHATAQAPG